MSQVKDVNVGVEAAAVAVEGVADMEEAVELELCSRFSQRFLCYLQAPVLHVHFITRVGLRVYFVANPERHTVIL